MSWRWLLRILEYCNNIYFEWYRAIFYNIHNSFILGQYFSFHYFHKCLTLRLCWNELSLWGLSCLKSNFIQLRVYDHFVRSQRFFWGEGKNSSDYWWKRPWLHRAKVYTGVKCHSELKKFAYFFFFFSLNDVNSFNTSFNTTKVPSTLWMWNL